MGAAQWEWEYELTKIPRHRSRYQAVDVIDLRKTDSVEAFLGWGVLQDCGAIILHEHHSINKILTSGVGVADPSLHSYPRGSIPWLGGSSGER